MKCYICCLFKNISFFFYLFHKKDNLGNNIHRFLRIGNSNNFNILFGIYIEPDKNQCGNKSCSTEPINVPSCNSMSSKSSELYKIKTFHRVIVSESSCSSFSLQFNALKDIYLDYILRT